MTSQKFKDRFSVGPPGSVTGPAPLSPLAGPVTPIRELNLYRIARSGWA